MSSCIAIVSAAVWLVNATSFQTLIRPLARRGNRVVFAATYPEPVAGVLEPLQWHLGSRTAGYLKQSEENCGLLEGVSNGAEACSENSNRATTEKKVASTDRSAVRYHSGKVGSPRVYVGCRVSTSFSAGA